MRELKFRAWNKENSEMLYDVNVSWNGKVFREVATKSKNSVVVNKDGHKSEYYEDWDRFVTFNYPVMQFVGLQDKNGQDIYEGDIINLLPNNYLCVVEYNDNEARFSLKNKNGYQGQYTIIASACEVVGNIYENKNLLGD
jgi:uncharacterized phage protein (TIGR01671 family)